MSEGTRYSGKQCPNGHSLDPNWDTCPYCEGRERSRQRTRTAAAEPSAFGGEEKPVVGVGPQFNQERKTRVMPSANTPETGGRASVQSDTRRIVGALVTYTWVPGGELYPVREGKNYIGRGDSSDPAQKVYEIHIPQDEKMSVMHALILCRAGRFEIIDQESSNGTFLGEKFLTSNQSYELNNYAEIRTGCTLWIFIKIDAT